MHTPAVTVEELLAENRRLREQHAIELRQRNETLLDEFAKAALPAIIDVETTATEPGRTNYNMRAIALEAYRAADAMLIERDERRKRTEASR